MHQRNLSFAGHGRQCVANSMMAIIKSKAHNIGRLTEVDADTVLRDGDRIYQLITNNSMLNSEYLLLDDLPSVLENTSVTSLKSQNSRVVLLISAIPTGLFIILGVLLVAFWPTWMACY